MLVRFYTLAILGIVPYVCAADLDNDTQVSEVLIKDSPVRALNNLSLTVLDLSKNKGCTGDNCTSAVQADRTSYGDRGHGRGRDDDFSSKSEEGDTCDQPRDSGICRGRRMRWYYNARSGTCNQFSYSGCGGNANNFPSRRRCESECSDYSRDGGNDWFRKDGGNDGRGRDGDNDGRGGDGGNDGRGRDGGNDGRGRNGGNDGRGKNGGNDGRGRDGGHERRSRKPSDDHGRGHRPHNVYDDEYN